MDIGFVLEIGEANDATFAMRGTTPMGWARALESHDADAAPGEVVKRGAPHGAETDDGNVKGRHSPDPLQRFPC
jgi:hypothetical protein